MKQRDVCTERLENPDLIIPRNGWGRKRANTADMRILIACLMLLHRSVSQNVTQQTATATLTAAVSASPSSSPSFSPVPSQTATPTLAPVSTDGSCGPVVGRRCDGSAFSRCCRCVVLGKLLACSAVFYRDPLAFAPPLAPRKQLARVLW